MATPGFWQEPPFGWLRTGPRAEGTPEPPAWGTLTANAFGFNEPQLSPVAEELAFGVLLPKQVV